MTEDQQAWFDQTWLFTSCVCPVWVEVPQVQTRSRSRTGPGWGTNRKAWTLPLKILTPEETRQEILRSFHKNKPLIDRQVVFYAICPNSFYFPVLPADIHRWGKRWRLQPHRWRTAWGHWSCSGWFPGPSAPPPTLCGVTSPPWRMGWRWRCASVNCCSPPGHILHSSYLWLLGAATTWWKC